MPMKASDLLSKIENEIMSLVLSEVLNGRKCASDEVGHDVIVPKADGCWCLAKAGHQEALFLELAEVPNLVQTVTLI